MSAEIEAWEVFARQDADIPIRHIGRVDAATLDDAVVFARTLYEEWKWTDMFIVPRQEISDGGEARVMGADLLVFGRTEYAEPLTRARGPGRRASDVLATYRGQWVELVTVPRSAVHWIIRDGEDAESEHTVRARR